MAPPAVPEQTRPSENASLPLPDYTFDRIGSQGQDRSLVAPRQRPPPPQERPIFGHNPFASHPSHPAPNDTISARHCQRSSRQHRSVVFAFQPSSINPSPNTFASLARIRRQNNREAMMPKEHEAKSVELFSDNIQEPQEYNQIQKTQTCQHEQDMIDQPPKSKKRRTHNDSSEASRLREEIKIIKEMGETIKEQDAVIKEQAATINRMNQELIMSRFGVKQSTRSQQLRATSRTLWKTEEDWKYDRYQL
ncbi:hypothetical protein K402DRAFT_468052 [Aulographum hederae CBS 113979]|uniref:Uncharacterized protein n=1 Tax=Aulographum hederae CBS 113979 TaxID=1176131 RepID=A0A6G1GIV9_9PEZI|nr:hypothetical protein K402DRAFT_468052 [Aulographum hederae CBS 113979]